MPKRIVINSMGQHVGVTALHIDMRPDLNDEKSGVIIMMDTFSGKIIIKPYKNLKASKVVANLQWFGNVESITCLIPHLDESECLKKYHSPKLNKYYDTYKINKVVKKLKKDLDKFSEQYNIYRWIEFVSNFEMKYNDTKHDGLDKTPNELCEPMEEVVMAMKQLQIEEFDRKLKDSMVINQMNASLTAGDEFPNGFRLVSKHRTEGKEFTYRLNKDNSKLVLTEEQMLHFLRETYKE